MSITKRQPNETETKEKALNEASTSDGSITKTDPSIEIPSIEILKKNIAQREQEEDKLLTASKRNGEFTIMQTHLLERSKIKNSEAETSANKRSEEEKKFHDSWNNYFSEGKQREQLLQQLNAQRDNIAKLQQEELNKQIQHLRALMTYLDSKIELYQQLRNEKAGHVINDVMLSIYQLPANKINLNGTEFDYRMHLLSNLKPTFQDFRSGILKPEDFSSKVVNIMNQSEISYTKSMEHIPPSKEKDQHLKDIRSSMSSYKKEVSSKISSNTNLAALQHLDDMMSKMRELKKSCGEKIKIANLETKPKNEKLKIVISLKTTEDQFKQIEEQMRKADSLIKSCSTHSETEKAVKTINAEKIEMVDDLTKREKRVRTPKKDSTVKAKADGPSAGPRNK